MPFIKVFSPEARVRMRLEETYICGRESFCLREPRVQYSVEQDGLVIFFSLGSNRILDSRVQLDLLLSDDSRMNF